MSDRPHALLPRAAASLALAALSLAAPAAARIQDPPPSRRLSLELTSVNRLAGTTGSMVGAHRVARELERAGWDVEIDEVDVLLSLPRRLELSIFPDARASEPAVERIEAFDPDAIPPGDVPPFSAWAKSGVVRAAVVDVGYGLREDYERLADLGVDPRGKIALARYGRSYRGVKVEMAEQRGCVGVLLFSDPADDGAVRGTTWPAGPWKPDWAVQRGSIGRMAHAPGDPSTPGWPSPAPGAAGAGKRLAGAELAAVLPSLPCLPIRLRDARVLLENLKPVDVGPSDDAPGGVLQPLGPGPVEVRMAIDQPAEVRTIANVLATLRGSQTGLVLAGNHRDAWMRGAHDAGSGTVALMRAAQLLSERAATGWRPRASIVLAFWDAEESGLIGSTEWGEAHAEELREHGLLYVNADAAVSGTAFGASGTPGILGTLGAVMQRLPAPPAGSESGANLADPAPAPPANLWEDWVQRSGEVGPALRLPASGSDFTVFLHHLGLPVIDFGFSGSSGGQYHTYYDDFRVMDRFLDPEWKGHEMAAAFVAELLATAADLEQRLFDDAEAAREMADHARRAGAEEPEWLGAERAERLAGSFEQLALAVDRALERGADRPAGAGFYQRLERPDGLPERAWFKNRLWAPGLDTGYRSETFPSLRTAADRGAEALDRELDDLIGAVDELRADWSPAIEAPVEGR